VSVTTTEHEALRRIAKLQPKALRIIEENGFVFRSLGKEPGNFEHLAFTLYALICEASWIADTTLEE
jgi:hypothetical protein